MKQKKPKKLSKAEFADARKALYDSYGGVKRRKFKELKATSYAGEELAGKHYPSLVTNSKAECGRTNMMEPMILQREAPEVQEAIRQKAMRIVPQYNKGNAMYTPDGQDPSDLGRKK